MSDLAYAAVAAAGVSARRIDSGVVVVAKRGAATEQVADLARQLLALRNACDALKARRLSTLKAHVAQSEALETERVALEAEAEAAVRAEIPEPRQGYLGGRR